MDFVQAGIILNTHKYEECVHFYEVVLGLPISHRIGQEDDEITVFHLGDTYLMVEHGGASHVGTKPSDICPTKFRFNVTDIEASSADLRSKGVDLEVFRYEWGTTAEFSDPDGNRCALRSAEDFGPT